MTIFKIPRVAVHIPGETSRIKFQPEYEYPVFSRLYRGRVADPAGDPLRIIPHPKSNVAYSDFWYELEFDTKEEAIAYESDRLRVAFGQDEKTGETWFDTVYPGNLFDQQFDAAIESAARHSTDPLRQDPADKIATLCSTLNISHGTARTLSCKGWDSTEALAGADAKQLSKYLGLVNAAKLIALAEKELGILVNATPSELIADAKAIKATKK
jgi:hypothetical protein